MRIAVYTDYAYRRSGDAVYAERAFAVFLAELARHFERFVIVGRVSDSRGEARYRIAAPVEFVGLPFYRALTRPAQALPALARSLRGFWRALDEVDAVWLLGPHPLALAFAGLARLRGRRVALGVRQDFAAYVAARHPGRRLIRVAGAVLDRGFRALARRCPTVVVGPALAEQYRRAERLHELTVSLVREADVAPEDEALDRRREGGPVALSVGRLEREKNPLLLADVAAELAADGRPWRLVVCGEGPMRAALERRLAELGVADRVELRGYVPFGDALLRLYRDSDSLLHVSWTEGVPQVLLEALAAGLPVAATDVGGVGGLVGDAALLFPPGDAAAAAAALLRIRDEPELRRRLVGAGLRRARAHTLEAEARSLARFLAAGA